MERASCHLPRASYFAAVIWRVLTRVGHWEVEQGLRKGGGEGAARGTILLLRFWFANKFLPAAGCLVMTFLTPGNLF